ncbi:MAG: sigma 54-interacting transcriptional regulator [Saprospiraceae bacterium]|nr:sigma 54-interacting transcriptional regulator [Candidatus Defluviibacterium haderslevense]MBK7244784.1 sigma 54-interacting transcriptional regulator [Candidatus Defluviibacterium haderslevense]
MKKNNNSIKTLGELIKSGYQSSSIKHEIRKNLITKLSSKEKLFEGIYGYDKTVIPDLQRALLSEHNILFLGLRGQAKTRIARQICTLLNDEIPIISGSELNDDPLNPISAYGKKMVAQLGDQTPIEWINRTDRYVEKLATPDVSVSDLIGDIDPIKAVNQKLSFADEQSIHYGLIPRSNRSIFVINELPDLQARIQVSLFNILEEGDVQIRGFKVRMPLDILFVFTANPEDYTHRGSIITPLKDRIESQIITHYPDELEISRLITQQEAKISPDLKASIRIPEAILNMIEQIAFVAREHELVDEKSGVSARLTISALELLYSAIERRMLINGETKDVARIIDLLSIIPAITGKLELVYEGEQKGTYEVALEILNEAIQEECEIIFPPIEKKKKNGPDIYKPVTDWFVTSGSIDLESDMSQKAFIKVMNQFPTPELLMEMMEIEKQDVLLWREMTLHYLCHHQILQKEWHDQRLAIRDPLANMLNDLNMSTN